MKFLEYGNSPVPMTTEWGREVGYHIARCPYVGGLALCQMERQGEEGDRPAFGRQHFNRQRRAAYLGLCDLCGKPLRVATKYSLSEPLIIDGRHFQLEPLLHRECAGISLNACPHLRAKSQAMRRVTRFRAVPDILKPEIVAEQIPDYSGPFNGIVGYAFIEILAYAETVLSPI